MIWIGTSGWQYRDWQGAFYPADLSPRSWLGYYAKRFPTTELNASFYRLPAEGAFGRWAEQTPEGFVMSVKASRYLTHLKRLREPAEPVERIWNRASELEDRLGPVLFQLPPRFPREIPRLRRLLKAIPKGMNAAFEFRDPSWHVPEVFSLLKGFEAALVWADRPGARIRLPLTAPWAYLRFHQGRRDAPGYRPAKLRRWADRIASLPVEHVYVYFNNDPGGAAIRDARMLTNLLREAGLSVARPDGDSVSGFADPPRG